MRRFCLGLALALLPGAMAAAPLSLRLPGPATETARITEPGASYRMPLGPWQDGRVETRVAEGTVEQVAWRIAGPVSTLDLLAPLRKQVQAAGWQVLYECETDACGGFDFRYDLLLMTEPDMHVDLGDFRYLAAAKGDEVLSLMVSRSQASGFVQMTRVQPGAVAEETGLQPVDLGEAETPPAVVPGEAPDIGAALEGQGHAVLEGLDFASGAARLETAGNPALQALADWLAANPSRRIALVGHTDASGNLATNLALSKQRAAAVRQALIAAGADGARIEAQGVGYLAPRASNLTEAGRMANRRVEAILTSTE
ncbi:OmpA family protein [Gemmobacter sp. LW-1]|uniref:OmpA family protein n=1 Tax=Gemmobacter sp. LW-1 TaxID=1529005 RepID=UPI0006C73F0F|nr:OmpA family protein [Gemmobacter sp. LW-1]